MKGKGDAQCHSMEPWGAEGLRGTDGAQSRDPHPPRGEGRTHSLQLCRTCSIPRCLPALLLPGQLCFNPGVRPNMRQFPPPCSRHPALCWEGDLSTHTIRAQQSAPTESAPGWMGSRDVLWGGGWGGGRDEEVGMGAMYAPRGRNGAVPGRAAPPI